MFFPLLFPPILKLLSSSLLGREPSQNPWCLILGPNEAQALDVSLQKNSVRDTAMCKRWICSDLESSTREGNGNTLQYSCLENPMDGGAWYAAVHGVAQSRTRLSDFTFTFHFHALEKEMATHSNILAWRIPGTREPGGLLSMGSHRVGHD